MAIPQSGRGNAITTSNFEAPFETPVFPYGVGGIDLASPLDRITVGRYSRLSNVTMLPNTPGGLTARPGQTSLATAGTEHHSIARMNDPQVSDYTRLWGIDTSLYLGKSGALGAAIDTGYSGDPLTFLPYHPPLSGDPWMFIADRSRMRKVRFDGLDLPIALPAPTVAAVTALGTVNQTPIATFTSADGTQWSAWTGNAGVDSEGDPTNPPSGSDGATDSTFLTKPTAATLADDNAYYSFWGLAKTLNLGLVGAIVASDDDIIHLNLRFKNPASVAECRIYFVCSPTFSPSIIPGEDTTANTDFYMKSFRPGDFSTQVSGNEAQVQAAENARLIAERERSLQEQAERGGFLAVQDSEVQRVNDAFMGAADPSRKTSKQGGDATTGFTPFGTLGFPLRRGDFARTGDTVGADWTTITGIIIYLSAAADTSITIWPSVAAVAVTLSDLYLFGGAGPDTIDPATQSYDVRYTNFDPRTGDESNPSPEQDDANFLDALRTEILITPTAHGDANVRQRFYRRGGILTDDWYFLGENTSDGGTYTSQESDLAIAAAGTLALDNYEPVPTVDDAGTTVLAQPVPVLIGPTNDGQLFALGDPYRPGTIYASKPGEPDHWPPDLRHEVCSPGEELLNGVLYGGQIAVFSRESNYIVYPNLLGANGMTSAPGGCTRGLAGRWALTTGEGRIWGVSQDCVFATNGGPEEVVSDDIAPLFQGKTVHGYLPIDLTVERALRLQFFQRELYFAFQDTEGVRQVWVYTPLTRQWRHYGFAQQPAALYTDEIANLLLLGGRTSGASYTHTGVSDDGVAIAPVARTGAWDWGRPREEKLFGDQFLDCDTAGVDLTLQNFVNTEGVTNPPQTLVAAAGRARAIFDSFGTVPQRGRNLATEVRWSSASAAPVLYLLGTSITPQPDITINRVTNWDDLGHPDQSYVMGITLDADTGGSARTIIIERDYLGAISTIAVLTITHAGRSKHKYSWPALPANQVRIRPDDTCVPWICYRADWLAYPEPPRVAVWNTYFDNAWDQYFTGLDIFCDTEGLQKDLVVEIDGVVVLNPVTGLGTFPVTTTGKQVVHLTLPTVPPLRGHVARLYATDANPGLLYDVRWHTEAEPSEQHNWNQPFTLLGTQADKYVKAIIFEVDTFGQDKTVRVEADGVAVDTLTVNTTGRQVVQLAIPQQLGRVWRFIPTDFFPSRLYSLRLVFDEEPFALTRWETQEIDHEQPGFHSVVEAMITLKSSVPVDLTLTTYVNQTGTVVTDVYTIPSTGGIKLKRHVRDFVARKGVLYKYLFTADLPFWLYQEESQVTIQPWEGGAPVLKQPFGNSDVDRTRRMVNATLAAAQSGGGT